MMRTLVGGAGLQVSIAISVLVALPFVARELSSAEFGVFAVLTGFAALFALADFGIGGALTTRLAEARGQDDQDRAIAAVSTAVAASVAIGLILTLAMALASAVLPWQSILGTRAVSESALFHTLLATAFAIGLSGLSAVGQRVLYGIDRGGTANLWLLAGSICTALTLVAGTRSDWPLFMYVLVALGVPVLAGIASGLAAVAWHAPHLRPKLRFASRAEWQTLRNASGWYFVIGLAAAVSFQLDAMIVANVVGASAAGEFALAARLLGLVSASLTPALLQLWPAFGDALARGDLPWIRSRLVWATVIGCAASLAGGVIVVWTGPEFIGSLFTAELRPDRILLVALSAATVVSFLTAPSYMLLNAAGRARVHALVALGAAAVNLPVSFVLAHRLGIAGPAWGTVVASVACTIVPGLLAVRAILKASLPQVDGATPRWPAS